MLVANIRALAVNTVTKVLEQNGYSHIEIRKTLDNIENLSKTERAFYTRLTEGTIEQAIQLDYVINLYSKTKTEKMKPFIRNLLRVSVYQIIFMDSVPDSAACNEAVKLATGRGFAGLKGFVNGVLRNISRNADSIKYPDKESNLSEYLKIKYSMPLWLVEKCIKDYGPKAAEKIFQGYCHNEITTSVRVNTSKASVEAVIRLLESQNVNVKRNPYYESALYISGYDTLNKVDAFTKGLITVQNISSMLAGIAANPKKGNYVIDVCAAPGGKSIHIGDLMDGTGTVDARDLTDNKVSLIQENIVRTGMTNVHAKKHDALIYDKSMFRKADIVIADLPCSGLGVLSKKSDIKYKINEKQIKDLAKFQRDILSVVSDYVKPGGVLIYSTCTITPEENMKNAEWFVENFPFEFDKIENLSNKLARNGAEKGCIQILPGTDDADGFFIARLKRNC